MRVRDDSTESATPARGPRPTGDGHPLSEWLVPVIIFAFCGVIAWMTTTFDKAPEIIVGHAMQPRNFPLFLCALIAVLNVVLIVQMIRQPPGAREPQPVQTLATAILVALFYPGTVYVDMFIALAVIMFAMCLVWGERRIWVALLTGVLTPVIIFFSFDMLLGVRFPRGILTNLYYG